MSSLGHQLSVYVDGVKLRSNDILQRGDQLYETTQGGYSAVTSYSEVTSCMKPLRVGI